MFTIISTKRLRTLEAIANEAADICSLWLSIRPKQAPKETTADNTKLTDLMKLKRRKRVTGLCIEAFARAGILTVSDLAKRSDGELLRMKGFGRECLSYSKELLALADENKGTRGRAA